MGYPVVIENPSKIYLITMRTNGCRLWFVNNQYLEYLILAHLARYAEMYGAVLYAFILMGDHYHLIVRFPNSNRSDFLRSFNSIIAKLVATHVPNYREDKLWGRRYSCQELPNYDDVEHWFFYVGLNPISSGLGKSIYDFEQYNSLIDSLNGNEREYKVVERWKYNEAKRYRSDASEIEFTKYHVLKFERLPGYEERNKARYRAALIEKIERRTKDLIEKRLSERKGFATKKMRAYTEPGSIPKNTKQHDTRFARPIVLSLCKKTKMERIRTHRFITAEYREASKKYRDGDLTVNFPSGTYPPFRPCKKKL